MGNFARVLSAVVLAIASAVPVVEAKTYCGNFRTWYPGPGGPPHAGKNSVRVVVTDWDPDNPPNTGSFKASVWFWDSDGVSTWQRKIVSRTVSSVPNQSEARADTSTDFMGGTSIVVYTVRILNTDIPNHPPAPPCRDGGPGATYWNKGDVITSATYQGNGTCWFTAGNMLAGGANTGECPQPIAVGPLPIPDPRKGPAPKPIVRPDDDKCALSQTEQPGCPAKGDPSITLRMRTPDGTLCAKAGPLQSGKCPQ